MALKLSTCLRNKMLSGPPARHVAAITAATIAAVDGGGGNDSFTDSGSGFLTAGFSPGDAILSYGFTGGMAGIYGPFTALTVVAGTIEVATGLLTGDTAGESVTLVAITGGSLRDIFKDCVLKIYSGAQPSSPNDAVSGTLLVTITLSSGTFVSGAVANGLEFGAAAAGVLSKKSGEVWSGVGVAAGTAGYFRLFGNGTDAGGQDTTYIYPRLDGSVGVSGSDLNMSSTTVAVGATITVDTFNLTLPASS